MNFRASLMAGWARQAGRPEGFKGRLAAVVLNRSNRTFVRAAVSAAGLRTGQSAADIGFGGGVGLGPLLNGVGRDGHVYGIDLSQTMVGRAQSRFADDIEAGRLVLQTGDLAALPLPDQSVDAVITVNTIYFVDDLERAFAELARVLRPAGRLVVGVGDPRAMEKMPFTAYGFTLRPVEDVAAVLHRAGFGDPRDERIGRGESAFHLLVADRVTNS
jgi:SAM-dependent methyltransferase